MHIRFVAIVALASADFLANGSEAAAQSLEAGRKTFEQRCARCHGADGDGGEMGPPIALRLSALSDEDLTKLIHEGRPLKGMPGMLVPQAEMAGLVKFLRTLQREAPPIVRMTVQTTDGRTLEGQVLGEGLSLERQQARHLVFLPVLLMHAHALACCPRIDAPAVQRD